MRPCPAVARSASSAPINPSVRATSAAPVSGSMSSSGKSMKASTWATRESRSSRKTLIRCPRRPSSCSPAARMARVGLRADQVHHRLGLGEVHPAIEKGTLRKFSRLRRARPGGEQCFEHPPRDEHPAVAGNFHHVLAGVTRRTTMHAQQHLVERMTVAVHHPDQPLPPGWKDHQIGLPRAYFPRYRQRRRTGNPQQGNGSFTEGAGHGGNGVRRHAAVQRSAFPVAAASRCAATKSG